MEQLTDDDQEFSVLDPETRATIDGASHIIVGDNAAVVIREQDTSYGIPGIDRVTIVDPIYVDATTTGTVVYKISSTVTITEQEGNWILISDG